MRAPSPHFSYLILTKPIMPHFITINLTQKDIDEYKRIHLQECGEEISDEEAREYATTLIRFVSLFNL